MDELVSDAVEETTNAVAERLDYHLRGAWRAGYEYVHIFHPVPELEGVMNADREDYFTTTIGVLPSNLEKPPQPDGYRYQYSYDLSDVDDEAIRAALRGYRR